MPAIKGIKDAFISEHNLRIHAFFTIFVLLLSAFLNLNAVEWSILIICIALVIGAEILNSAIEQVVNLVSPEISAKAGRIKDFAAGAVLIFSIAAILAGLFILGPKLYHSYNHLR
ncbi:MAG: diacylglycerol kinase family protein [Bacteroidota bacterium]|nr:diacylglycerol kinase family protein [Bacteroidota bacterium]